MIGRDFHAATSGEIDRLTRTLVAAKVFADADELRAMHTEHPWRVQVNPRGDVAVLGRWRDHLPFMAIEALWCPLSAVSGALLHVLDLARAQGFTDVVTPPTPVEDTAEYLRAGMRSHATVATLTLGRQSAVPEALMPERTSLRLAGHRDIDALLAVDERCFEPFWRYDARHLSRFCGSGRLVMAERDGEAVGYTLSTAEGGEGLLGRLCVTPRWRRRGIGSALLSDAIQYMRDQGAARVTLSTQTDNEQSQSLYRQAHFRDTGRRYAFLRFGAEEGEG
jgi:ribosomal-protein-alanine N-acetyltransferase